MNWLLQFSSRSAFYNDDPDAPRVAHEDPAIEDLIRAQIHHARTAAAQILEAGIVATGDEVAIDLEGKVDEPKAVYVNVVAS